MTEPICPRCKRQYPKGWTANARKRQGKAISDALRKSQADGNHIGRKIAADYNLIYKLRDAGMGTQKIANIVGCSRGSVQHAIRIRTK